MNKFIYNPIFLLWIYYLIGPFLSLLFLNINIYSNGIVNNNNFINYIFPHLFGYLSLVPLIFFIIKNNTSEVISDKFIFYPKIFSYFIYIFIFFEILILLYLVVTNFNFIFFLDIEKARIYINLLENYKIITLIFISLILIELFLNNKTIYFLLITSSLLDIIFGRRQLIIFLVHRVLYVLNKKIFLILILIISILISYRHGLNTDKNIFELIFTGIFSESLMIFLSTSQHVDCRIYIDSLLFIINFERFTEYCRIIDNSAGGFISRFQFNIIFGLFSILIYTFIFSIISFILKYFCKNKLLYVRSLIFFLSFFILFRDDLGKSLYFLIKYSALLLFLLLFIYLIKGLYLDYGKK